MTLDVILLTILTNVVGGIILYFVTKIFDKITKSNRPDQR